MKLNTNIVRICYILILTYLSMMILKHLDIVKEQFHMLYERFYDCTNTGVNISNLLKDTGIKASGSAYTYNPIITNNDTNVDDTNVDDSNTNIIPLTQSVKKVPLTQSVKKVQLQAIDCKIVPWGDEICYNAVV